MAVPKNPFTWTLGRITFRLVHADLFTIPVDAIVNSEQTNFIMAPMGPSISAQINQRWGESVQKQLDALTDGRTLPAGTVLETESAPHQKIFHAGFHHPHAWYDPESADDEETEHLKVIRRCVRRVLERVAELQLSSVAFPLIGAGVFGLDPKILTYGFFDEIILFATETKVSHDLTVWLAIYGSSLIDDVLEAGVQSWVDRLAFPHDWEFLNLGVSFLDIYEQRLARVSDPHWKAFLITQYAELVTAFLHAVLASVACPPVSPQAVIESDRLISFGTLRSDAMHLAKRMEIPCKNTWGRFFAEILLHDARSQCLERINQDRNNIAHKRAFRPFSETLADLRGFLSLDEWRGIASVNPLPPLSSLNQWIHLQAPNVTSDPIEESKCVGVLERWNPQRWTYLNPITGRQFNVPGEPAPAGVLTTWIDHVGTSPRT
jgi:O-acetyl-ADP-ribose deacetylase (regulator of RNase III)